MANGTSGYESSYGEGSFWSKCQGALKSAGAEVLEVALKLYYALQRPETPVWAKTAILGALGYFISPVDVIPDVLPVVGFTDDLGILVAALGTVSQYVDDAVVEEARATLRRWGLR